ncbi:MAG: aminotransferase class I/II-fold pyridoxal phosphate-dependent enzyme [Spartobacteria bacterium]|nr:aminotransferase class I/II-fold pyridoxal phosphate-dependent enzyme [Spartobacteria bacterium]
MRMINSDHCTQADFFESTGPDLFEKTERFSAFLTDWRAKGTYAYHREACMSCASHSVYYDPNLRLKKDVIVMASNNYLGLNTRPELIKAATHALRHYGTGLCGSRFLSGTSDLISMLEHKLAEFEQREDAMVFTTGYQANVGTLSALLRPGDTALIDRLCHASIVDGCRQSWAESTHPPVRKKR